MNKNRIESFCGYFTFSAKGSAPLVEHRRGLPHQWLCRVGLRTVRLPRGQGGLRVRLLQQPGDRVQEKCKYCFKDDSRIKPRAMSSCIDVQVHVKTYPAVYWSLNLKVLELQVCLALMYLCMWNHFLGTLKLELKILHVEYLLLLTKCQFFWVFKIFLNILNLCP